MKYKWNVIVISARYAYVEIDQIVENTVVVGKYNVAVRKKYIYKFILEKFYKKTSN